MAKVRNFATNFKYEIQTSTRAKWSYRKEKLFHVY